MEFKNELRKVIIESVIRVLGKDSKIDVDKVGLEYPTNPEHGDYSTSVAMVYFNLADKSEFKSPVEFANAIVNNFIQPDYIESVEVVRPGFINFKLKSEFIIKEAFKVTNFELLKTRIGEEVIVEYSSPNIAKPFTIGHFRSTIVGDAVSNLLEAKGVTVYRDNHIGDWGTQFGNQIYAIKTWGDEDKIANSEEPVKELVNLYIRFHKEAEEDASIKDKGREWFKKLESGDAEARRIWKKCIEWSWKEFDKIYQILDVKFTENEGRGYGESYFEDKMQPVVDELKEKNLLVEDQGAHLVYFDKSDSPENYPPLMIIKSDGTTLYSTRDLATDKFRLEKYGKDIKIINEVGSEQSLYFKQLFEVERLLGWVKPGQRVHIKHGLYLFDDQKMSSRKGNVVWLKEVLEEAFQKVRGVSKSDLGDESTWSLAVGAMKWNDLRRKSMSDVPVDWDELARLDGNSGPYMQYAYVRCLGILNKGGVSFEPGNQLEINFDKINFNSEADSVNLAKVLLRFPSIIESAANEYAMHYLAGYLFELGQQLSSFYENKKVLAETDLELRNLRLQLILASAEVIKFGLNILGIKVVDKM